MYRVSQLNEDSYLLSLHKKQIHLYNVIDTRIKQMIWQFSVCELKVPILPRKFLNNCI